MKKNKLRYLLTFIVIMIALVLVGCAKKGDATETYKPIYGFRFWSWDFLVWPMSGLMYLLGKLFNGSYALVIVFSTIIVRSLAWPIYAKSNDMSLKTTLMIPEQQKIEAKYANRTDQESMQRKQMEMMQLYKKWGVGIGGCLTPLMQLPIFIAFFETLRRIPLTRSVSAAETLGKLGISKLPLDFEFLNGMIFGVNLFEDKSAGGWQKTGIWILAIVVGITQIASQMFMNYRQKKQKEELNSSIPEYRRPAPTESQKQTESMMKVMLYGMPLMMVVFIITSPAALGFYWLVGNLYSTLQSYIGSKNSKKRMEKLKQKVYQRS